MEKFFSKTIMHSRNDKTSSTKEFNNFLTPCEFSEANSLKTECFFNLIGKQTSFWFLCSNHFLFSSFSETSIDPLTHHLSSNALIFNSRSLKDIN